jgi:DSF synthase
MPQRISALESELRDYRRYLDINTTRLTTGAFVVWVKYRLPKFTLGMLHEIHQVLLTMRAWKGDDIAYIVWDTDIGLGGDLAYFLSCIRAGDRQGLAEYAELAVTCVWENFRLPLKGSRGPVVPIGLVRRTAKAGAVEAMASSTEVFACESAEISLPEVLIDLFAGMGAKEIIARTAKDPKFVFAMMRDGKPRSVRELHEQRIVQHVIPCDVEDPEAFMYRWLVEEAPSQSVHFGRWQLAWRTHYFLGVSKARLRWITNAWIDQAMGLSDESLGAMERISAIQERRLTRTTSSKKH